MRSLVMKWAGFDRVRRGLARDPDQSAPSFVRRMRTEFGVRSRLRSRPTSRLAPYESAVFLCTHHTGALDFLAAYPELAKIAPDLRVVMNHQLEALAPLAKIAIGVHPISSGKRNAAARAKMTAHLRAGGNLLVFPAGKVGRLENGEVVDLPWRTGIAEVARDAADFVVPVHVDARNGRFFYFVRRFFPKLSLLFLLRCLRHHADAVVPVHVGEAMPREDFELLASTELLDQARSRAYSLPNRSLPRSRERK